MGRSSATRKLYCTGGVGGAVFLPHCSVFPSSTKLIRNQEETVRYLKVPKREIFDRSDFPDFYTIKSTWVGDLLEKILTNYFNF